MAVVSLPLFVISSIALVITKLFQSRRRDKASGIAKKLPGPKGLPIIGNVHELPTKCSWMKFHEWSLEYGPIYQVNLAGTNHVWISRDAVAHELLSKRSAIYSNRPFIPALEQDNRTSGQYLPLMGNNLIWSRQRRFAKQIMDRSQKDSFHSYPELESIRLLFELMVDPSRYNHAMESFVARVTSRLAWGTSTPSEELKQRARELLIGVSPTGALGNKLPFLMSLPEKLVKAKAWEWRRGRTERQFFELMQEEVHRSLRCSDNDPPAECKRSWTCMFLEEQDSWGFSSQLEGAYAVGMHGIAGALTIAAPMQSFCLAISHYPQYQAMLLEEIDRVVGERMPTFQDIPEMPVLRACIRETLRWRPPVPTGIPHELTQDDVYEGYDIPKGSVIHPLEWSISRDPNVFPEPDVWNPLRWLQPSYPTYQEPLTKYPTITQYSQFGYGRRTCLGMGVTEADLFVGLSSVLWLFEIHGNADVNVQHVTSPISPLNETRDIATDELPSRRIPTTSVVSSGCSPANENDEKGLDCSLCGHWRIQNDSAIDLMPKTSGPTGSGGADTCHYCDQCVTRNASPVARESKHYQDSNGSGNSKVMETSKISDSDKHASFVPCGLHENETSLLKLPGSWPFQVDTERTLCKNQSPASYESDPTMDFSTLLIAKPMPFKLVLRIRNKGRAQTIAQHWVDHKMKGEFQNPRVYWQNNNQGDSKCGWGETFA